MESPSVEEQRRAVVGLVESAAVIAQAQLASMCDGASEPLAAEERAALLEGIAAVEQQLSWFDWTREQFNAAHVAAPLTLDDFPRTRAVRHAMAQVRERLTGEDCNGCKKEGEA